MTATDISAGKGLQPIRGTLLVNESMAKHTSWRVGGVARRYFRPADLDDLAAFLNQLPSYEPIYWIGLGSNLLVRDGGLPGSVISTSGVMNELEVDLDHHRVRVGAGVACAKLARFCARHGLAGAEFFVGIPGTVGGALAMNAGAFGGETWPLVDSVETIDRTGTRHRRTPGDYQIGYRSVKGPGEEWFVSAVLCLTKGDGERSQALIKSHLSQRGDTQPTGQPSCGSVFRNPPKDYAGRLIEASGLKGFRIGGAQVSEKHANFIVNTGAATAGDIEELIQYVADRVEREQGVRLVPEVHIIGEPPRRPVSTSRRRT